jgi:hypothetical protein
VQYVSKKALLVIKDMACQEYEGAHHVSKEAGGLEDPHTRGTGVVLGSCDNNTVRLKIISEMLSFPQPKKAAYNIQQLKAT